ncbi:MAG: hypothetical protein VX589_00515 [Myxococcota bacterium]|nr:hypothetical protein [Myxococcota bacterium]
MRMWLIVCVLVGFGVAGCIKQNEEDANASGVDEPRTSSGAGNASGGGAIAVGGSSVGGADAGGTAASDATGGSAAPILAGYAASDSAGLNAGQATGGGPTAGQHNAGSSDHAGVRTESMGDERSGGDHARLAAGTEASIGGGAVGGTEASIGGVAVGGTEVFIGGGAAGGTEASIGGVAVGGTEASIGGVVVGGQPGGVVQVDMGGTVESSSPDPDQDQGGEPSVSEQPVPSGTVEAMGGQAAPIDPCQAVDCGENGQCVITEAREAACNCDVGFISQALGCQADPVSMSIVVRDETTGLVVAPDQIRRGQRYQLRLAISPVQRAGEVRFADGDIAFTSPFGVADIGDVDVGDAADDGHITFTMRSPGRVDVAAVAQWMPDGRILSIRTTLLVDLIEFQVGQGPVTQVGHRLTDQDAIRLDNADIPNLYNLEYIPVRFSQAAQVAFSFTPNFRDVRVLHEPPTLHQVWRSSRPSLFDASGREIAVGLSLMASAFVSARVDADQLYYLGVSYHAVCHQRWWNLDRLVGQDVPTCYPVGTGLVSRSEIQFGYDIALGEVQPYTLGESYIGSLAEGDVPVPRQMNNYFDFFGVNLEAGTNYELRYRPTRVGNDLVPLLRLGSGQAGRVDLGLAARNEVDVDGARNVLAGIFRAEFDGQHTLAILNNLPIENPGLGVAYGFSISPVDDANVLSVGRVTEVVLEPGTSPLGYVWNDLDDKSPMEMLALPANLNGQYRVRISAEFPVQASLLGTSTMGGVDGRLIRTLNAVRVEPAVEPAELVFDLRPEQSIGLALSLAAGDDASGGIVLVRLDACGADDCQTCDDVDCGVGGQCIVDGNGRAQCACADGFINAVDDPLKCLENCPTTDCDGRGQCYPIRTRAQCVCERGYGPGVDEPFSCQPRRGDCRGYFDCRRSCLSAGQSLEECGHCSTNLSQAAQGQLRAYKACRALECSNLEGALFNNCVAARCGDAYEACFSPNPNSPITTGRIAGQQLGGEENVDRCPPNEVLIGLRGELNAESPFVQRIQGVCGQVETNLESGFEISETTTTLVRGGAPGHAAFAMCPENQVVTGIRGRSGIVVNQLQVKCASIRQQDGFLRAEMAGYRAVIGGSGGDASPEINCPLGELATGINTRWDTSIFDFGLVCDHLVSP